MGSPRFVCRPSWTSHRCSTGSTSAFLSRRWSSVPASCNGSWPLASTRSALVGDRSLPDGALNADDLAPQPDLASATEVEEQPRELPVAVLGFLGDRAAKIPGRDAAREDHHAVLILDHHAHSVAEPGTFKA